MRRVIALASAAAITLATLPAAFAQTRAGNDCPPDQGHCIRKDEQTRGRDQGQGGAGKAPVKSGARAGGQQTAQTGPKKGDTARGGQPFQRAASSRFQPPPNGQEYRVVNDHLVLADSQTMRVVAVIGLLSSLLN